MSTVYPVDAGNSQLAGQEPEAPVEVGPRPEVSLRHGETLPTAVASPGRRVRTCPASPDPPAAPPAPQEARSLLLGPRAAPEAGVRGRRPRERRNLTVRTPS